MQTRKPVSEFYRSKANADGYDGRCKACDAIQCADRRKKKPRIENPTVATKVRPPPPPRVLSPELRIKDLTPDSPQCLIQRHVVPGGHYKGSLRCTGCAGIC